MRVSKLVYLAGPIDLVSRDVAAAWRVEAANRLAHIGCSTFNPAAAFRCEPDAFTYEMSLAIDEINSTALRASGIVLAHLQEGQTAIGMWREVERATMAGIPVYLVAPHLDRSYAVYDLIRCNELKDAVERIQDRLEPAEMADSQPQFDALYTGGQRLGSLRPLG